MSIFRLLLLPVLILISLSHSALAQTLTVNAPSAQAVGGPASGMTMAQVEQKLGAPTDRLAPVGEPPITRWVYSGFTVFFENDRVLHTVARR